MRPTHQPPPCPSTALHVFLLGPFSSLICLLLAGTSADASNGIRQRNSSVPLRQVVENSVAQSSSLLLVHSPNVSQPSPGGPAGRHAVIPSTFEAPAPPPPEGCVHCDPGQHCAVNGRAPSAGEFCVVARTADGSITLWRRCLAAGEELDKMLWSQPMEGDEQQQKEANGCRQEGGQRICWCQMASASSSNSLLYEGHKSSSSLHARRRKNHHSHGNNAREAATAPSSASAARVPTLFTFMACGQVLALEALMLWRRRRSWQFG